MIVDKDTARLICKLEYELGSQTYNPHSYNGWTGEEGCGFKYPVKYCKNKNALITSYQIGMAKMVKKLNIKFAYDNICNIKSKERGKNYEKNKSVININNIVYDV